MFLKRSKYNFQKQKDTEMIRLRTAEGQVSDLENIMIECIKNERETEWHAGEWWDNFRQLTLYIIEIPKAKKKKKISRSNNLQFCKFDENCKSTDRRSSTNSKDKTLE